MALVGCPDGHPSGVPVSRMTLLRLVRALPEHVPKPIHEIGIDDFAFRRGHVYGTVVIKYGHPSPVGVLPDRTSRPCRPG